MTNPSFNPDDPRLTAFVLGEIDDADRAEIEQLLEASPEARAFVDDLQDTIGVLRDELSSEPASSLTDDQRAALQHAAESANTEPSTSRSKSASARSRRSLLAGVTATIAALGIVIAVLPQLGNQQAFESSPQSSLISMLSGEEGSFADASGAAGIDDKEVNDTASSTSRQVAQLTEVDELEGPFRSTAGNKSFTGKPMAVDSPQPMEPSERNLETLASGLASDAGKDRLQVTRENPSTSSQPVSATAANSPPQNQPIADKKILSAELKKSRDLGTAASADEGRVGNGQPAAGNTTVLQTVASPVSEQQIRQRLAGRTAGTPQPAATTTPLSASPAVVETAPTSGTAGTPKVAAVDGVRRRGVNEALVEAEAAPAARAAGRSAADTKAIPVTRYSSRKEEGKQRADGRERYGKVPVIEKKPDEAKQRIFSFYVGLDQGREGRRLAAQPGNETYEPIVENEFVVPDPRDRDKRMSTISVDVDTASYANVRRFLMQDRLPPPNAVRIEELVNYFKYDYPQPEGDEPFSVTTELMLCPWQPGNRLARIGLQAKTIDKSQRPPTNLVFLLDVSGSMRPANKLPLVQQAMRLLVEEMTEDDQIAIVTYASNAGLRLVSTPGSKKSEILQSIDSLTAGGSTNGEGGIKLAYDTAIRHYIQDGSNRVILCTDGDFNVGVSNDNELVELIQEKAASGVFLSVFGFGMGNLKDGKLEKLADKGNGQYGYIDSLQEARRAFKEGLVGTLYTVAKDVKLQAEFNPATVGAYRLIGYENRKLAAADFTDDTKDAGEIGAGHQVTALYEIVPRQVLIDRLNSDEFRYTGTFQLPTEAPKVDGFSNELFFVRLRYKQPDQESSEPIKDDFPVNDIEISGKQLSAVSLDFQWAAAVASFGMNLRNSQYRGNWDLRKVHAAVVDRAESDDDGRRKEFVDLVQRTLRITGQAIEPVDGDGEVKPRPVELPAKEARIKASVDGKYRRLLKKIEVRDDASQYGAFHDYGYWDQSTEYKGHADLLPGHWVYVYPHWYIWGEVDASRVPAEDADSGQETDSAAKPAEPQLPATPKAVR
ncbi:MAG: YfbK domain-containing protein [Planctomycetota bacterium]|jgi:Ca-activated chloride channel family protein